MQHSANAPKTAGLLRRLAVIFYDSFLLLAIFFLATAIVLPFTEGEAIEPGNIFYTVYLLLIGFLFFSWFWMRGGQTLGMRAWRIRVQCYDAGTITWWQALLRYLFAIISWMVMGLGFLWSLWDKNGLAWHDIVSQSRLVVIPRPPKK